MGIFLLFVLIFGVFLYCRAIEKRRRRDSEELLNQISSLTVRLFHLEQRPVAPAAAPSPVPEKITVSIPLASADVAEPMPAAPPAARPIPMPPAPVRSEPQPQIHPVATPAVATPAPVAPARSEEHTSELQPHSDLVCRLLL